MFRSRRTISGLLPLPPLPYARPPRAQGIFADRARRVAACVLAYVGEAVREWAVSGRATRRFGARGRGGGRTSSWLTPTTMRARGASLDDQPGPVGRRRRPPPCACCTRRLCMVFYSVWLERCDRSDWNESIFWKFGFGIWLEWHYFWK